MERNPKRGGQPRTTKKKKTAVRARHGKVRYGAARVYFLAPEPNLKTARRWGNRPNVKGEEEPMNRADGQSKAVRVKVKA